MKRRGRMITVFLSVLAAMMLTALSVNAEAIQNGKKPAVTISNEQVQTKATVAKPKIQAVYNGNTGIHIRVPRRYDVLYYNVYRKCSDDNVNRNIGWAFGSATDMVDTTVNTKWGKTYTYSLVAVNLLGKKSSASATATYVRIPPVKYTGAKAESNSKIKLTWKSTSSYNSFSGFEVQYAKSQSNLTNRTGTFFAKTVTGGTSTTLTGLSKGTTYYIRIKGFKNCRLSNGKTIKCYSMYSSILKIKTPSTSTTSTKYRALLIGNGDYRYASDLRGPKNDVNCTANVLNKYHYSTTKKMNLTKSQILSAISSTFKGAGPNDISLFFYSGHGGNNYNGTMGYLVGVDSSWLSMSELADALKKIPGKVIVVLDSCNSGNAIERNAKAAEIDYSPEKFDRAAVNAFAAADTMIETNPGSDTAAKNGELRNSKFLVLAGGRKNESTYDVPMNGIYGGLFTRYFVQGAGCSFPGGGFSGRIPCDSNSDKKITLNEMYNYTSRNVLAYSGRQHVTCYPSGSASIILKY